MSHLGFIKIIALADNGDQIVAPLGELSDSGYTYAIDKSIHSTLQDAPGLELTCFRNRGLRTNLPVPAPTTLEATAILKVAAWCYANATTGVVTSDRSLFLQNIRTQFVAQNMDFDSGEMFTNADIWLPEWVSWTPYTGTGDTTVLGEPVKIWFRDESFRTQFAQYDIGFVIPVDRLDDLHKSRAEVQALIALDGPARFSEHLRDIVGRNPQTFVRPLDYEWIDKVDRNAKINTTWWAVAWGLSADNPDLIREQLMEYILANSTQPRSEWEKILPDLFVNTEFIIVPNWDQYSIPNKTTQAGLYSPTISNQMIEDLIYKAAPLYPSVHVKQYGQASTHPYRSLAFAVCGGNRNRDNVYDFYTKFPKYISVPTSSVEISRTDDRTREWMTLFNEALIVAERISEFSDVPSKFARLRRSGVVFLAFSYEKIQYLIATKLGITADDPKVGGDLPAVGQYYRHQGAWVLVTE